MRAAEAASLRKTFARQKAARSKPSAQCRVPPPNRLVPRKRGGAAPAGVLRAGGQRRLAQLAPHSRTHTAPKVGAAAWRRGKRARNAQAQRCVCADMGAACCKAAEGTPEPEAEEVRGEGGRGEKGGGGAGWGPMGKRPPASRRSSPRRCAGIWPPRQVLEAPQVAVRPADDAGRTGAAARDVL